MARSNNLRSWALTCPLVFMEYKVYFSTVKRVCLGVGPLSQSLCLEVNYASMPKNFRLKYSSSRYSGTAPF